MTPIRIHLRPEQFTEHPSPVVEHGPLRAVAFRFPSGVAGLRLENELGHLVMLPFQGQQIWSAHFRGRELTMRSMFDQPWPTQEYLRTYGGFLLHCGATRMGVPGPEDDHPLHGELPNAPFQEAWLEAGQDREGPYMVLSGRYRYTVAFTCSYDAVPRVTLHGNSSRIHVEMAVHNRKRTPMELMYLAHANFRPVDNGRLVYSARPTPEHVRVRRSIPAHIRPGPGYLEFLETLAQDPAQHHLLRPDRVFDPEVVFLIDYLADEDGWAHSLQLHPDGQADYVAHRPEQLPIGIRWISRTPDQDALGLVLPATAEPEGYTAEKAKGYVREIPSRGTWRCEYILGALPPEEAERIAATIQAIVGP